MAYKLEKYVLDQLKILEPQLRRAAKYGHFKEAERLTKEIHKLFPDDRNHYRVLQAKNWFFQAALEDNKIRYAIRGYENVRIRANQNTRTYLEATVLLGICHLRDRNIDTAKKYIREAILNINNIKSDQRRNQLQKRIIQRIEFECILGQLKMEGGQFLESDELHKRAVIMLQNKSEQEIFTLVGEHLPQSSLQLTQNIKNYSIKLLPFGDQKLLNPPPSISSTQFGEKVLNVVKSVGWRTICDPDSEIYNLWEKQVPEIFNKGYFASAMAVTCAKFSIGIPMLAIGAVAIIMKYSAAEFCDRYQPQDLMISRKDKR